MRPAREPEFGQDVGQDLQKGGLFFIYWHQAEEAATIMADGLDHVQALELGDDAPGRHL